MAHFQRLEGRTAGSSARQGSVDKYAAEWLFIAHFRTESQTPMQPRQHKTASFLSAHPVFTRAEFAAAFGHPAGGANVTSLLRHHLRAGNIKRVSREASWGFTQRLSCMA
jgi:hypothetical protein